jgi:hypothetical protein
MQSDTAIVVKDGHANPTRCMAWISFVHQSKSVVLSACLLNVLQHNVQVQVMMFGSDTVHNLTSICVHASVT